jgi:thioredoxin 1
MRLLNYNYKFFDYTQNFIARLKKNAQSNKTFKGACMDELERIKRKKLRDMLEKMSRGGNKVSEPIKINENNFKKVLSENENVVVDFWAEWCGPCRIVAPVLEELAKEYAGTVVIAKLNTDENQALAARFGISAIPTLIFFKKGKPVDQIVGAFPKSELKRWIDRNLGV